MKTIYVATRRELTELMANHRACGAECYRVRTACQCWEPRDVEKYLRSNQRNGVLVIIDDRVMAKYVRCRVCSKPDAGIVSCNNVD